MKVAVTCTHLQRDIENYRQSFADAGLELHLPDVPGQELAGDELISAMAGMAGVVAGDDQFTESVLRSLPDLRVISKWGIGLDGIDLAAADQAGITVTNTPGMFGNEVAEQALGYLLALVRGICSVDRQVRAGGWPKPVGRSVGALTVGVLGLGDIGRSLATKLQLLGATVIGADPSPASQEWAQLHDVQIHEPGTCARESEVLIVTAPLNAATKGLVDEMMIASMPHGALLINVGRGPIVVGSAVVDALRSGQLSGAALDVFEIEPLEDDELRTAPNLILGSHNASNTLEACHRTHAAAIANLVTELGR